jgi:hypothetical protein
MEFGDSYNYGGHGRQIRACKTEKEISKREKHSMGINVIPESV